MKEQYIYGINTVRELLRKNENIDKIYVEKGEDRGGVVPLIVMAEKQGIVVSRTDRNKLYSMTGTNNHQGIVAMITDFQYSTVEDIVEYANELGEDPFVLILDEIEDTHNLGAIIRTGEAAGVHGVIIPNRRSAQVNETVYRTSAGAVAHMKVARVVNISKTLDSLKDMGLWIYGGDMKGESIYYDTNLTGPIGLVIGGEDKGITDHIANHCDMLVQIPMVGEISSLNASTSAAILIYEVLRQKNKGK